MVKHHDLDHATVDTHLNHLVNRRRCQKNQKDPDSVCNLVCE